MLIGGDDISNDVITLGTRFFCLFTFALISGNLTTQSAGSHRGIGGGIQIPETYLQALLPFPAPPPERLGALALGLMPDTWERKPYLGRKSCGFNNVRMRVAIMLYQALFEHFMTS